MSFDDKFAIWKDKNAKETETFCQNLLRRLKAQQLDPILARIRGKDSVNVRHSDIMTKWNAIEKAFKIEAVGSDDVKADVFFKFNKVQDFSYYFCKFM